MLIWYRNTRVCSQGVKVKRIRINEACRVRANSHG